MIYEKKAEKNIDIWWFNNSFCVRGHFCLEGVQRVQNESFKYKRHVRVKNTGFKKFDWKEGFLQNFMP